MSLKLKSLMAALALAGLAAANHAAEQNTVDLCVDWATFLGRHDIVWEKLPERFDHGIWHGNGLLGAVIYREGKNGMRWELGRSDVTARRRDNNRLPIGGMVLETVGGITNGTARLELWNAESSGTIETTKGSILFRTFTHAIELVTVIELECSEGEQGATVQWVAAKCIDQVNNSRFNFDDPPNPESRTESIGNVHVCLQPRHAGGEFATAWREVNDKNGKRRLYVSIADTYPKKGAGPQAAAAVQNACSTDVSTLRASHQAWWHAYYPKSFVTVPDGKIEGFYWIQIHKLACATRQDRPVMDLLGPWFRNTGWPRIWWNLNIQTAYLSVYTANHLEIGESLTRMMDRNRKNFVRNAKEIWGVDGCATVPHTTCYEGLRGDGSRAPDKYINPGDFTWALHNYYLQYRYSMNHSMVTDHERHAFYPLLRGSVNLYLHLLEKGDDGKLHLPAMHSPEYGHDSDNNYNLSLLRWACQTLLALDARYAFNDPLAPRWREVLATLVDYPTDEHGLRVGAELAATKSHRHWSHMLMMHPLRIMNWEQPANQELMRKSVDFWLVTGGGRGLKAWSRAAAASLYAGMGDGDKALENLHRHHDERRFVMPNGMYIEGAPVIECALVAGRSLHDMLLQSWGETLRVFPAVPAEWKDCAFHDLRTEGAFLVSAVRADGATQWIRIKSLAGEPCRVVHGMEEMPEVVTPDGETLAAKDLGSGVIEVSLAKGQEALLRCDKQDTSIRPLELDEGDCNYWGVKVAPLPAKAVAAAFKTPALSTGKPAKASGEWSNGYAAAKAFDDDMSTRWGCKPRSRSGWLEVDLGKPQTIGRVVIVESEFPRTEQYSVEYKDGETWRVLAEGKQIGGVKTVAFNPVTARYVRLNIIKANEVPTLEEFRVLAP